MTVNQIAFRAREATASSLRLGSLTVSVRLCSSEHRVFRRCGVTAHYEPIKPADRHAQRYFAPSTATGFSVVHRIEAKDAVIEQVCAGLFDFDVTDQ